MPIANGRFNARSRAGQERFGNPSVAPWPEAFVVDSLNKSKKENSLNS